MRTLLLVAVTLVALGGTVWPQTPRPTGAPDNQFAERFRQADTNGDGVITPDEARAAHLLSKQQFNSVDTDHSGTVTLFELGEALQQRLSHWLADFDAADTNHDGKVSKDEAARSPAVANVLSSMKHGKQQTVSRQQYESYALDRITRDSELPSVAPNIFEKRF